MTFVFALIGAKALYLLLIWLGSAIGASWLSNRAGYGEKPGLATGLLLTALVVGNEGKGISRLVREHCDLLIRLPMRGHINSLNAAVAGSIALYEALRQRQVQGK